MCKAVIFDLDGTIIHSLPDIAFSINVMLEKFGYPKQTDSKIMQCIGSGARNLVKNIIGLPLTEDELDERLAFYNHHYTSSNSPRTTLFDGINQVILQLKERGYKVAVLTNKPQITTDDVNETYLKHLNFDMVVGQRKGFNMKPDPAVTLSMLKEMGVDRENAYFVGDGETDVLTALNAGVKGIAALWGYRTKAQLENAGAKVFAKNPLELLDLIK